MRLTSNRRPVSPSTAKSTAATVVVEKTMSDPSSLSSASELDGIENPRATPTTSENTTTATTRRTKKLRRRPSMGGRFGASIEDHSLLVRVESTARQGSVAVKPVDSGSGSPTATK